MSIAETPPSSPSWPPDLSGASDDELAAHIRSFASRIAAAMCAFLLAVAEYDRREAWAVWECRSMTEWLSWQCAISAGTAAQYCRTAQALVALPVVQARFAVGELSYSQVRAICRVATAENEELLVDLARSMTANQLEQVVSSYRRCREVAEEEARHRDRRRTLQWGFDEDGSITGVFRLPPEDGAVLVRAIGERVVPFDPTGVDRDDETADPIGARRADALVELAAADLVRHAGDDTAEHADRHLVTVIADLSVLRPDDAEPAGPVVDVDVVPNQRPGDQDHADGHEPDGTEDRTGNGTEEGAGDGIATDEECGGGASRPAGEHRSGGVGRCQVAGGPGLAPSTIRRLLCDQPCVTILTDQDGTVLDVGRRTRRVNRALDHRDRGCRFPGCQASRIDAHHVWHWVDGGPTRLDNLVSLCARHHHRHHQGGFRIEGQASGTLEFVLPNGQRLATTPPDAAPSPPGGGLAGLARPDACTPDWDGSHLDLPMIIDGLQWADRHPTQDPPPSD